MPRSEESLTCVLPSNVSGRYNSAMPDKKVSQRTMMSIVEALRSHSNACDFAHSEFHPDEFLYANGFPEYLVKQAAYPSYHWNWARILMDLRSGKFYFVPNTYSMHRTILDGHDFSESDMRKLGEFHIQRLAALVSTLETGEQVERSLQLDGFAVDKDKLRLIPLEGPVSAEEEVDALTALVKGVGLPNGTVILKHMKDAQSLYLNGTYHSSLNESRSLIQALIDEISTETERNGKHSTKLPGSTANRMDYLRDVGFFTEDERAAVGSAWGTLSAGSHPGISEQAYARIGLVLTLEFGQFLLFKFENWKANAYCVFS
jgi:hypothetical protein